MTTEIILIRHGEAYNTAPDDGFREVRDRANPPLTLQGEQQARELLPVFSAFAPDLVVVSPFLRAVQTIWPWVSCHRPHPASVLVDVRFGEIFGSTSLERFAGVDLDDYRARFGPCIDFDSSLAKRGSFPAYPEKAVFVRQRVAALWNEIDGKAQKIAFVGHGASLGALLTQLVPELAENTGHVNCGVSHLRQEVAGGAAIWHPVSVNDARHLTSYGAAAALA